MPLYFEEAKGQPDGTIKFLLKGNGVNQKKAKSVDPKDGLVVCLIHGKDNTIEVTQDGKKTRILTVKNLNLIEG